MTEPDDSAAALREMADREAIRTLQARYADLVARRAWADLVDLYLPQMPTYDWQDRDRYFDGKPDHTRSR